jgi:HEPN domain-containing protein
MMPQKLYESQFCKLLIRNQLCAVRELPHSVAQLAERCAQFDTDFAVHIPAGRILDQYYIPTRYPDALAPPAVPFESYTQEQGARAVAAVQVLVALVTQKFSPASE